MALGVNELSLLSESLSDTLHSGAQQPPQGVDGNEASE
jgi:hypothetical protein